VGSGSDRITSRQQSRARRRALRLGDVGCSAVEPSADPPFLAICSRQQRPESLLRARFKTHGSESRTSPARPPIEPILWVATGPGCRQRVRRHGFDSWLRDGVLHRPGAGRALAESQSGIKESL
jgi:hypothetical protein